MTHQKLTETITELRKQLNRKNSLLVYYKNKNGVVPYRKANRPMSFDPKHVKALEDKVQELEARLKQEAEMRGASSQRRQRHQSDLMRHNQALSQELKRLQQEHAELKEKYYKLLDKLAEKQLQEEEEQFFNPFITEEAEP